MHTKEELLTLHFSIGQLLQTHFRRRIKPQDRQEVQQEIMEKIMVKGLGYSTCRGELGAWLFRLIQNHLTDKFRKKKRNKISIYADMSFVNLSMDAMEGNREALHTDQWQQYNELLSREKPEDQLIVRLKHEEGLKYEEIAARIGIPKSRLAMRYRRTIARMQQQYHPYRIWQ